MKLENRTNLLPLGSVVSLDGASMRLMVIGRLQQNGDTGEIYDYSAVLWPMGLINTDKHYLFNNEAIDRIWFLGLQDTEEFEYRKYLESEIAKTNL